MMSLGLYRLLNFRGHENKPFKTRNQVYIYKANFGECTRASEHTRHTRNAHHELALRLPHYTCGVTTGTVAVGNELQLFCS